MDAPVLISGLICLRMPYDFSYRSGEVYSIELGTAREVCAIAMLMGDGIRSRPLP
jgi:hypothetical protein